MVPSATARIKIIFDLSRTERHWIFFLISSRSFFVSGVCLQPLKRSVSLVSGGIALMIATTKSTEMVLSARSHSRSVTKPAVGMELTMLGRIPPITPPIKAMTSMKSGIFHFFVRNPWFAKRAEVAAIRTFMAE